MMISMTFRRSALLAAAIPALLWSTLAVSQDKGLAEERRVRFAIAAGLTAWGDLHELRPQAPGEFDSTGFVLDFGVHWKIREFGSKDLLFGFDLGALTHDSSVFHLRDEVTARGMYLAPSVKWQLGASDRARYSLDFGVGYYLVDITEIDTSWSYGYYCCYGYSEVQLWEDTSLGAYLGTTVDFGRAARRQGGGFTMGARIHWLGLKTVHDEFRFPPVSTLGPDAGRLDGPIYSVLFGYVF